MSERIKEFEEISKLLEGVQTAEFLGSNYVQFRNRDAELLDLTISEAREYIARRIVDLSLKERSLV